MMLIIWGTLCRREIVNREMRSEHVDEYLILFPNFTVPFSYIQHQHELPEQGKLKQIITFCFRKMETY